jgi:hypothetical protein
MQKQLMMERQLCSRSHLVSALQTLSKTLTPFNTVSLS